MARPPLDPARCLPVDVLRGLTILWIAAFHFYADTRGGPGADTLAAFTRAVAQWDAGTAISSAAHAFFGLPSYRLDVFLAVTGLALALSRPRSPLAFWRDRARAVLPNYWCGTVAAVVLLVALALLRSGVHGTAVAAEIADGTLLARGPYHFEWTDVVRSLSVVGRLQEARAVQVVAPSLWYLLLVLQLYLAFPLLRWLMSKLGPAWFLGVCLATMCAARLWVLNGATWQDFGVPGTLTHFLPFRLFGPAMGMVMAEWVRRAAPQPSRRASLVLLGPAMALLLATIWYGAGSAVNGVYGATGPLVAGLPALWVISADLLHAPVGAPILVWIGRHSLAALVAQDLLRLVTGTSTALWGRLDALTWYLLPFYLLAVVALTAAWHRVPEAAAALVGWRREPRPSPADPLPNPPT